MTAPDDHKKADHMDSPEPSNARRPDAQTTDTGPDDDGAAADESPSTYLAKAEIVEAPSVGSDLARRADQRAERKAKGLLPALRADLSPLVPPLRRAATVVAVAALADWVVRAGSQRLARQAASLARSGAPALLVREPVLRARPNARPSASRRRSETVIVERIIIHRS